MIHCETLCIGATAFTVRALSHTLCDRDEDEMMSKDKGLKQMEKMMNKMDTKGRTSST